MKVDTKTVHETKTVVRFDENDVHKLFTWAAQMMNERGPNAVKRLLDGSSGIGSRRSVSSELSIEQVEEGSPAYKLQKWRATVAVTEDHSPQAAEASPSD